MTERLLQFIWQFQYFNRQGLATTQGEPLEIVHAGHFNRHQGPDFSNARIRIGNTEWAGNIELHVLASDWHRHQHSGDPHYTNIILHVVWQHDVAINDGYGTAFPALVLQPLVSTLLLQRYQGLMHSHEFVPCSQQLPVLSGLGWLVWKERLAVERLQRKSAVALAMLATVQNHWEEVLWRLLARNFGAKVNADTFEAIAAALPVNLLAKHKNQVIQLEAMLLGHAGLLQALFTEDYAVLLQREYQFLKKKYNLPPPVKPPFFLRMRPANFPTIRLAQLAMLVHQSSHLFSKIKELEKVDEVKLLLNVTANDYWHYHYRLDEPAAYRPKQLGHQMVDNIIINTVVPVLFAYGSHTGQQQFKEKALQWLGQLSPEVNSVVTNWKNRGVAVANAQESQALIELKNNYCSQKRCLECAVGNALLKQPAAQPGIILTPPPQP